jgi:predicted dehydrogenase
MTIKDDKKVLATRRDFIKTASVAAAGFMIVPRHVLGGKGFTAPSDKLSIASVGVGGKGFSDISYFSKTGKAEIEFLCDVDDDRAAATRKAFPKAKYYKDWRELFDKKARKFDAVSVSTPDHNHAIITMHAMQMGKHVYVQKPMAHDIYETRMLTEAAKRYKVVTQMGNQGSSIDGTRQLSEWYDAGLIGDVQEVYAWTDRPIWPQGIQWPSSSAEIPKGLDWNLWLGTAHDKNFVEKLVPFNWRGWWDYGTGALGDMGAHLLEPAFRVLDLKHAKNVQASVGTVFLDGHKPGYFPESCPPSSHATITFPKTSKTLGDIRLHWMDGGIQPARPSELESNELFGDGKNGMLFIGTKGKMIANSWGANPRLLPLSRNNDINVPETIARVPDQADGHYGQWVEAAIAGYGKKEVSSPFEKAGPLTEAMLMANLAIRGYDIQETSSNGKVSYPGRYITYDWDSDNMKVTNFDAANQFIKREYREGWTLGV